MSSHDADAIGRLLEATLDRSSDTPLSRQIADGLWDALIQGAVRTGERLPTVRHVAIELGVPPGVVQRAYDDLERRGVVKVRPDGVFLVLTDGDPAARERATALDALGREAVSRAEALGFSLDDLLEAISDLRDDRASRDRS